MRSLFYTLRRMGLIIGLGFGIAAIVVLVVIHTTSLGNKKTAKIALNQVAKNADNANRQTGINAPSGGANLNYHIAPDKLPLDIDKALSGPALALIAERSATKLPSVRVDANTTTQMTELVDKFLAAWENFAPNDAKYASSVLPYIQGDSSRITNRQDNRQPAIIGPCGSCSVGSKLLLDQLDPGEYMIIRHYDGNYAWVTTQAYVMYTGKSLYAGAQYRRTYGLILARQGDGWRVVRAAAESLDRI